MGTDGRETTGIRTKRIPSALPDLLGCDNAGVEIEKGFAVITPTKDRVLIEEEKQTKKTNGGLFLPEQVEQSVIYGKVVSAGKEADQVSKGDRVLFPKHAGMVLKIENKPYIIIAEKDILAKENQ